MGSKESDDAFIFLRSFLLRTAPHYLSVWNRLSDSRKDAKVKGTRKVGGEGKRKKEGISEL